MRKGPAFAPAPILNVDKLMSRHHLGGSFSNIIRHFRRSGRHHLRHAYGFYDPEMVPKMVAILRFYHNWMLPGRDGRTPAMRIRLARGHIYPRDLFSY